MKMTQPIHNVIIGAQNLDRHIIAKIMSIWKSISHTRCMWRALWMYVPERRHQESLGCLNQVMSNILGYTVVSTKQDRGPSESSVCIIYNG